MSDRGHFAAALLQPALAPPAGLRSREGCDPARRFAVHRNNVLVSLIDGLSATFPVTAALVGEDFFAQMAAAWIRRSPPLSPVLAEYGAGFPEFIASFAAAVELPYLADVARLEWLLGQSLHAADARPLNADAFRPWLHAAQPPGLRLRLHPACRWLRSTYPAFSIWSAHQQQEGLAEIDLDCGEHVLLFRPEHEVRLLTLPPGGADFLDAIQQGLALEEAAVVAALDARFDLAANLRGLIDHGLACAVIDTAETAL